MRSFGRITRKIYTPSSSRATRVFHDISFDARHDRYNIFALFPIVLSILQQRRSRFEQIGLHVHFRLEGTRRMFSGHVAPWFMRHDNRFVAGSMGIRVEKPSPGNLRDLLQLLLPPSERIGYATKWSGTRIKDSVVFSFEDQGIPTLFHFSSISSIALVTLFSPFLNPSKCPSPFIYHVPREPDVASTLANQLDFATRMRPARLNFKPLHPTRFHSRHMVSSLADS